MTDTKGVNDIRILGSKKETKRVEFSTVDEIIEDIKKTLSLEFLAEAKEMTADEFRMSQHSNLGKIISNKYFYKNKAREKLVKRLDNKKDHIFLDGDVFSRIVLEKLYENITTEKNNG